LSMLLRSYYLVSELVVSELVCQQNVQEASTSTDYPFT